MKFSLSQQRIAFLTAACLGSSQVLPANALVEPQEFERQEFERQKFERSGAERSGAERSRAEQYELEQQQLEQQQQEPERNAPEQNDIRASEFVLMAIQAQGGSRELKLLNLNQDDCGQAEQGRTINPLMLGFNVGGTCDRTIDGHPYSIRAGGEELNWRYGIQIVEHEGDLLLLGIPTDNPAEAKLLIARGRGMAEAAFAPLILEAGWRLTERVYNGKALEQLYLTQDRLIAEITV